MSTELLGRAARRMYAHDDRTDDSPKAFWQALGDWLDDERADAHERDERVNPYALAVARAYLGEETT